MWTAGRMSLLTLLAWALASTQPASENDWMRMSPGGLTLFKNRNKEKKNTIAWDQLYIIRGTLVKLVPYEPFHSTIIGSDITILL